MTERIQLLEEYLAEDPNDPFLIYALALEYDKSRNKAKAIELMIKLLNEHPDYLPVYYQLGKFYENSDRLKEAIHSYEKGIILATSIGNRHAVLELQSALNELIDNSTF